MKLRWSIALGLMTASLMAGPVGCGDDGGGNAQLGEAPSLEIYDKVGAAVGLGADLEVSLGGSEVLETLKLQNTGNAALVITDLSVDSDPPGFFALRSPDGADLTFPLEVAYADDPEASLSERQKVVDLVYDTTVTSAVTPTGTITIKSNAVVDGTARHTVKLAIEVIDAKAVLVVTPEQVDFGSVGQGDREQKTIQILNQGNEVLRVDRFELTGHPAFSIAVGASTWPASGDTASVGITLDDPIEVDPGTAGQLAAIFEPTDPSPAEGTLVLFSNDPNAARGTVIPLQGNVGGPCIVASPKKVDFGGKLVGKPATVEVQITSCGDQPLRITEIALRDGSSDDYTLALETLPGVNSADPVGSLGPADAPVVLQPNQTGTFRVVFIPDEVNPLDGDGRPIPDLGEIMIRSNAFIAELAVEVTGFGVHVECPTAVIIVQEGEEVIPQTTLHLIGSQSYAATGSIDSYLWEVQQPIGSHQVLLPSATVADPTFEANVAGPYVFRLNVVDSSGTESCVPAETTVFVKPDEAIHIELLWDTPNDPDQTDDGGADLDLHFTHPFATGGHDGDGDGLPDGWFDQPYDTFWYNPHPEWGSLDAAIDDNPGLDRDDTNGAGPENINLNIPESGLTYKVGVHYWDDHGYGASYATVRVYIFSNPVFEMDDVELVDRDMWSVASIDWPSGVVKLPRVCSGTTTPCETDAQCAGIGDGACGLRITPDYVHPSLPTPNP